jgi:hypothetical protein
MRNKMTDVRDLLIIAMEKLANGEEDTVKEEDKMTVEKAQQLANLGNVLINSAKVEIDFIKATGRTNGPTDFLGDNENKNSSKQLNS